MFLLDTIFLSLSILTGISTTILIFIKAKDSPLIEAKILLVGYILFSIAFILYLPITIWNGPEIETVNPTSILLYKIGSVFATIGIELTLLAIFLPTFRLTYSKVLTLLGMNIVYFTSSVLNFHIDIVRQGNRLVILYPIWTAVFIVAGQLLLIILLGYRIFSVSSISKTSPFTSNKSLVVASVLAAFGGLALIIPVTLPGVPLPTFTNALITSFLFLYFGYAFYQDDAFVFVTSARLEAILIADNETGISLYSKNFNFALPPEQLLASIFTSLNLSITEILQSEDIEEIIYGDKVILIARTKSLSAFMITTKKNFISKSILDYIREDLIHTFPETESEKARSTAPRLFKEIDYQEKVTWLKRYMPL